MMHQDTHPSIQLYEPPSADDDDTRADSLETDITEDEVDQLDSDLDDDVPMADASTSSPRAQRTRQKTGERVPGRSIIPLSKIDGILEADGEGGYMSKEAVYLLTIATEEFLKRLAQAGHRQASSSKRMQVNYRDLATTARLQPEFNFLSDIIPEPMSLSDALKLRAAKEKELHEPEEPATSAPSAAHTPSSATPSTTQAPRAKGKGRQSATKDADSISTEAPKRAPRQRKSRQAEPVANNTVSANSNLNTTGMTTRRRSSRTAAMEEPQGPAYPHQQQHIFVNGHHGSVNVNGSDAAHPAPAHPPHPEFLHPSAAMAASEPPPSWWMPPPGVVGAPPPDRYINGGGGGHPPSGWPPTTQYTGPASGYMEDHRMIFQGSLAAANPGRTIYSHRAQNSNR